MPELRQIGDERVRAALRRLEWRMRGRGVETLLAGEHRSIFRGPGMEPDQVVRFEDGDDIRDVDWHVTARRGELHRRIFVEEREVSGVVVLADTGALQFGSGQRTKRDVLLDLAALVMLFGALNRERVLLIHQSAGRSRTFPPARGRAQVLSVVREIFALSPPAALDADAAGAPLIREKLPRGARVLWLGEVPDGPPPAQWAGWTRRHPVIGVRAEDAWERHGPTGLPLTAFDPLAGQVVRLRNDAALHARHARWRQAREARWRAWWPDPANRLTVSPDEDPLTALTGFLRAHGRRRPARARR